MRPGLATVIVPCFVIAISSALADSGCAETPHGRLNPRQHQVAAAASTVWAADYLASGHTFSPGSYRVGGPVSTVSYHASKQELRLGQPLTITKTNLNQYLGASG
jgi:hypothetical protein